MYNEGGGVEMKKTITILIVFILGYLLGEIDVKPILKDLENEFIELNTISIIGLASSVTTLLVFLMYLIGKVYAIKKAEMFLTESFFVRHNNNNDDLNIGKEITLDKDLEECEIIYLVPNDPIREIKFYTYDGDYHKEGQLIESIGSLKAGEALRINTYLPCGMPNYIIKYERFDYVIGTLVLQEDGRGLTNFRTPEIKHTWRSYFYHLVKA